MIAINWREASSEVNALTSQPKRDINCPLNLRLIIRDYQAVIQPALQSCCLTDITARQVTGHFF